MAGRFFLNFDDLALNDPSLSPNFNLLLGHLQNDNGYGGIDNLIEVWESNVTVDCIYLCLEGYVSTPGDDARYIPPILDLIRNKIQLRKLHLHNTPLLKILLQFMEAAAENASMEVLHYNNVKNLPVGHLARFFQINRNIKKLELFRSCTIGAGTANIAATAADANNHTINALQTLIIRPFSFTSMRAANEFLQIVLHPSNQNLVELGIDSDSIRFGFDNGIAFAQQFFGALLGKPTIKRLKLLENLLANHVERRDIVSEFTFLCNSHIKVGGFGSRAPQNEATFGTEYFLLRRTLGALGRSQACVCTSCGATCQPDEGFIGRSTRQLYSSGKSKIA